MNQEGKVTVMYLNQNNIEKDLVGFNKMHFKKVYEIPDHNNKIYNKLNNNNIRDKLFEENQQEKIMIMKRYLNF